jgi:hypothetical protein
MDQRSGIVRQVRPNPGSQADPPSLGAGPRPPAESVPAIGPRVGRQLRVGRRPAAWSRQPSAARGWYVGSTTPVSVGRAASSFIRSRCS